GIIGNSGGHFGVAGTHIYSEEGTYGIKVTIHHDSAPDSVVFDTAVISDPAVIASGGSVLTPVEGQNSGSRKVATFTDPGGPEAAGDYTATISWGDGVTDTG